MESYFEASHAQLVNLKLRAARLEWQPKNSL
jgi:hypothetical protein